MSYHEINQRHLDFLEEAKEKFAENPRWETYRHYGLIALRGGADRDCMEIFELGRHVGFFSEVMEEGPELVVKGNELESELNVARERYEKERAKFDYAFSLMTKEQRDQWAREVHVIKPNEKKWG